MKLQMRMVGADKVRQALRTVPREATEAIRDEMRGMKGLGVEWKKAIAKTFMGRGSAGATRRGEKWLYSTRAGKADTPLGHRIRGNSLDTLQLTIYGKRRAEIHEFGGKILPEFVDTLPVPIHPLSRVHRPGRRGMRPDELLDDAISIKTRSGRILLGEPNDDEGGKLTFYYELKKEVNNPGGRLRFRATTARMRDKAVRRFERGLDKVTRRFDGGA